MEPDILNSDTKELISKLRKMEQMQSLSKSSRQICAEAASRLALLDYSLRCMFVRLDDDIMEKLI